MAKNLMIKIRIATLVCYQLILILISCSQIFASHSQAKDILEYAMNSSPLIKKVHDDGLERRREESRQLKVLSTAIIDNLCHKDAIDSEELYTSTFTSLLDSKLFFEYMNLWLKQNCKPGEKGVTYQLYTNKMLVVADKTIELTKDRKLFFEIIEGKLPPGYSIEAPSINYSDDSDHVYSHGIRGNTLKNLLLTVWRLQKQKPSISSVSELFGNSWLDTSPFIHLTPLPDNFTMPDIISPYIYRDVTGSIFMTIIHNGYAFGGHRNELRYPQGKKWGPHDCSSFVAKYINCESSFSTFHLSLYYQQIYKSCMKNLDEIITKQLEGLLYKHKEDIYIKNVAKVLMPSEEVILSNDSMSSLKAGLVHCEKNYNPSILQNDPMSQDDLKLYLHGTGGHMGFTLGTIESGADTKVLTIGANRDLEGNGKEFTYGIEARPFMSQINDTTKIKKQVMYFDLKEKY